MKIQLITRFPAAGFFQMASADAAQRSPSLASDSLPATPRGRPLGSPQSISPLSLSRFSSPRASPDSSGCWWWTPLSLLGDRRMRRKRVVADGGGSAGGGANGWERRRTMGILLWGGLVVFFFLMNWWMFSWLQDTLIPLRRRSPSSLFLARSFIMLVFGKSHPTMSFEIGGPVKQDLTSHVGPTL